jgi:TonB family protein
MLLRPEASQGPRPAPVIASLIAHMSVLATIALAPSAPRKAPSLYEREIAPHEKKLVWYRFDKKLPDVSPPKQEATSRPLRAEVKHPNQTIVSRSPLSRPAKQTILTLGPELKIERELSAPNLMAFEAPKPPEPPPQPKLFTPPPQVKRSAEQPTVENGPKLAAIEPKNLPAQLPTTRVPKPEPKAFVPPQQAGKPAEPPQLQSADVRIEPRSPDQVLLAQIPGPSRPKPKTFTPPPQAPKRADARLTLPTAPALQSSPANPALVAGLSTRIALPARPQPKFFTPPPQGPKRTEAATLLRDAPALAQQNTTLLAGIPSKITLPAKPQPKAFTPPPAKTAPRPPAPELAGPAANLTAAVVGLNPADRAMPVIPEGSRPAQFSAAPEITLKGGAGGPVESATLVIPDLMIRGGAPKRESIATISRVAPTSRENLLAAGRPVITSDPPPTPPKAITGAVRVTAAPDPHFEGRTVFIVAIQMPNVTSYSGSWILWYAERKGAPGDSSEILPPGPLRKVDPVYDLSAVEDRVEGKVQLGAVIHTDGYVYGITILRGVDARLDNSAIAALRKWEFEPARRDGVPVDVDVVIEIPFRLRPKTK